MSYSVENKRVLVVGMVRSGIAAARLLASRGALPILNDLKPREKLAGLEVLEGLNCQWKLGQTPDELLD
ncbi:MAG TPA: UDP-N-acetylmuramoyl-L-alanine--D-glutamate ligase, partial [Clostridia bacterium]|nr:UDP-N-acetylmuramoyl-L-alanine--D-glutamate ligase [Clostridia bacterium]